MIAKITKFEPLIINGLHSTYSGSKGTLYKFTVTFDNGTMGTANSTKQSPSWVIGEEYSFDISEYNGYFNIKGMKPVSSPYQAGSKSANNPIYNRFLAKQIAYEQTILFCVNKDTPVSFADIQKIVPYISDMLSKYVEDRRAFNIAINSLKMAVASVSPHILFPTLENKPIVTTLNLIHVTNLIIHDLSMGGDSNPEGT